MRRLAVLLVLTGLACSRSFPQPDAAAPEVTGLFLGDRALPSSAPVAVRGADGSATRLVARGVNLGGVTDAFVGGVQAANLSVASEAVSFDLPAPAPSAVGQVQTVSLRDARGERTAGTLRLYLDPLVQGVPKPVIAPGQILIQGSGFSPIAGEDLVQVGGVPATVILAAPDRLVVSLPATTPEGAQSLGVTLAPDGDPGAFHTRQLVASSQPLVWKVLPDFWIDPPQVFAGAHVRFRVPLPDGGSLAQVLDHATDLATSGDLDLVAVGGNGYSDSDGGTAASTGGTSGGNGGGTGGTVDLDAGDMSANYPPDSVAANRLPRTAEPILSDGGSDEVPAHTGLSVDRDGVDTGTRPLISLTSHALGWVVPPETPLGLHQVSVFDPAGASHPALLSVLPGHLAAPSLSCGAHLLPPGPAVPRALHLADVAGDVIYAGPYGPSPGYTELEVVHPGGAVESQVLADSDLSPDPDPQLVAAGRDLLYFSGESPGAAPSVRAIDQRPGHAQSFELPVTTQPGQRALAVLEPGTWSARTWVLFTDPLAVEDWSGDAYIVAPLFPDPTQSCGSVRGIAAPGGFFVVSTCAGSALQVGWLPVPSAGVTVPSVTWSGLSSTAKATVLDVNASGQVLAWIDGLPPGLYVTSPPPAAGGELEVRQVSVQSVSAAALSPDGTQVIAVQSDAVAIYELAGDTWASRGGFPFAGAPWALAYDPSGTQASIAFAGADGGSDLCVLR